MTYASFRSKSSGRGLDWSLLAFASGPIEPFAAPEGSSCSASRSHGDVLHRRGDEALAGAQDGAPVGWWSRDERERGVKGVEIVV